MASKSKARALWLYFVTNLVGCYVSHVTTVSIVTTVTFVTPFNNISIISPQYMIHHWISYGTSILFQREQWTSAQKITSFEFFGSWLAICIIYVVNWTMEIWIYYEKRKYIILEEFCFVTATLGSLSECHNLI